LIAALKTNRGARRHDDRAGIACAHALGVARQDLLAARGPTPKLRMVVGDFIPRFGEKLIGNSLSTNIGAASFPAAPLFTPLRRDRNEYLSGAVDLRSDATRS
jgi:hypothetical protein